MPPRRECAPHLLLQLLLRLPARLCKALCEAAAVVAPVAAGQDAQHYAGGLARAVHVGLRVDDVVVQEGA